MSPAPSQLLDEQDLRFQRWEWRLERVGWAALAAVAVAAMLGLFGGGPLGRQSAASDDGGVSVEFDRMLRCQAEARLRVTIAAPPKPVRGSAGREVAVWLSREYLDAVELQRVVPDAARESAGADGTTFEFHIARDQPADITFDFQPRNSGPLKALLRAGGGEVAWRQFVYP